MNLGRTTLFTFVIIVLSATMFSQSKKSIAKNAPSAKKLGCASGQFSFKCPEDYKVLLSGKAEDRLFLASNEEFRYGVFVVYEPINSITGLVPKILKAFLPKESQDFDWKDVEADPRKSSGFEVESKRRIGLNRGKAYLTLEYRQIEFMGKNLLTGTIVNGYEGPAGIRESFEKGDYTTNGGCFDSIDIIAAFTKEKLDPQKGPCFFTITMSPGS